MKEIMVKTGNEKEKGKAGSVKDEIGTVAGGESIQGAEVGIVKDMPTAVVLKGAEMEQKSQRIRRRMKRKERKDDEVQTTLNPEIAEANKLRAALGETT
ncbi:hypothetical protein NC651_029629 [Populus alba x Populus x berolinensis]|nr:hypothetical protein NC651_029629 [Populus alba x Populus x berolinensis]